MTSANQPKPLPVPAILVFGLPTSPDLPQASWFRAEDKHTAKAAAEALKLSTIDIETEEQRALTVGVHEGVLKGNGRMIVGSVTPEVYRRIEDYVRTAKGASASPKPAESGAALSKAASEQTTNSSSGAQAPAANSPGASEALAAASGSLWDRLKVGSHVVAKHWTSAGDPDGWWIAIITALDGNGFTIRWPDEPKTPPLKIERKHVAIPHPDFDVAREWDRKPVRRS